MSDQLAIDNAINSWNYALNGMIRLQVVSTNFDMGPSEIREVMKEGLAILKINGNSGMIPQAHEGTQILAFTNQLGGHLIFVIHDRFEDEQKLEEVMRHEISHALGAKHLTGGLMNPLFDRDHYQCIDQETAEAVAKFQGIEVNRMNWCVYLP